MWYFRPIKRRKKMDKIISYIQRLGHFSFLALHFSGTSLFWHFTFLALHFSGTSWNFLELLGTSLIWNFLELHFSEF
jgi:hypothetical protein